MPDRVATKPVASHIDRLSTEGEVEAALSAARDLLPKSAGRALLRIRAVLSVRPGNPEALELLGTILRDQGKADWEAKARALAEAAELDDPALAQAAKDIAERRLHPAERGLRGFLDRYPDDPPALRLLAALAERLDRHADVERLLIRALDIAPHFAAARRDLLTFYYNHHRFEKVLEQADRLLTQEPESLEYQKAKGAALSGLGRSAEVIAHYEELLQSDPSNPDLLTRYGHALRLQGRTEESVRAYREATASIRSGGRAWLSLANLKILKFDADDIRRMKESLQQEELDAEERWHLHFALAKGLQDSGDHAGAFSHYAAGNALAAEKAAYDPSSITRHVTRNKAFFTRDFFDQRKDYGDPSDDPIFIVGLPRAGSTLVEQILATHSLIEGTAELPYVAHLMKLATSGRRDAYGDVLGSLTREESARLGGEYLKACRRHRTTDRPFFIDKNPTNWLHLGFIRLILPKARIVDVRRHPLACGLSNFQQLYAQGHGFSYELGTIAAYYSDYLDLMRHFDAVLPGQVHRVIHEDLVENTEGEVRRLLEFIGVGFEEACLAFHSTVRPVRTVSSEQVRRPINREGVDRWRAFEPWLGPLKEALGDRLEDWRR